MDANGRNFGEVQEPVLVAIFEVPVMVHNRAIGIGPVIRPLQGVVDYSEAVPLPQPSERDDGVNQNDGHDYAQGDVDCSAVAVHTRYRTTA